MASVGNISKITLPNGDEYDLRVKADNIAPLQTKIYSGVVASADDDPNGWLYFAKIFPDQNNYYKQWRIKYRFTVDMTGVTDGAQYCEVVIVGSRNTYQAYSVWNGVANTSYRPIYAHVYYSAKQAGVQNGIGHALGIRLQSAYKPTTAGRNFNFELMEAVNCTVTFLDFMVTYANLPGTGSTNYQTRTSFDGTTQGVTVSGDRNSNTVGEYGGVCFAGLNGMARYSLIMQVDESHWESLVLSSSTETNKTKNTSGFLVSSPLICQTAGTYASGDAVGQTGCWVSGYSFDTRYSFNVSSSWSTAGKPLFLVGTIMDGLFYLKDSQWWADTLPNTNDGYVYRYVGQMTNAYQYTLHPENPFY